MKQSLVFNCTAQFSANQHKKGTIKMTCPVCQKQASGMYCQACGMGLMTDAIDKAAAPKDVPVASVDKAVAATEHKYQAILADQAEKSASAYDKLAKEHAALKNDHEELKRELSVVTTELANVSKDIKPPVVS